MESCDSCAQAHTPALTESIKELTKELRECRRAYLERQKEVIDVEKENVLPQEARVWGQESGVKTEPKFAEANEITADNRYLIPDTWGAEPEMGPPLASPLASLKRTDGNVSKPKPKTRARTTARMSTGGRKQRGGKEIATKHNARKKKGSATDLCPDRTTDAVRKDAHLARDPLCENAPMSLALEGFSSANEVIEAAERIRRRTNPDYRTVEDAREETKTGKHTGCATCRLRAYESAEGRANGREIYEDIVGRCTHVALGGSHQRKEGEGAFGNESEEDALGPGW